MTKTGGSIHVLHVDDEPDFADMAATFLEREDDRIEVSTATSASEGLDRFANNDFDCIVSDYDMPGRTGIKFLEVVREEQSDFPFILFTGKGSEEVASDAISAGATDYLQKEPGTDQYELLANRIRNAVEQYRAQQRATDLDRIRTLRSDINQALVRAESRTEAETRVCEIISASDPYLFAWIGVVDPDTDRITPRTSAGTEEGYLDDVTDADGSLPEEGPGATAIRERRVVVSQNVAEDPAFEPWREEALDRGYQAGAAIPLEHQDTLYGELAVYADRPNAFDEDERELLAELGADIAHACHSFEVQDRLEAERDRRQALIENAPAPVIVGDTQDDRRQITDVNEAFEDVFGFTAETVVGRDVADILVPDDEYDQHQTFRDASDTEPILEEVTRITADGPRDFLLHIIPYGTAGDRVDGWYAWYTDITEREERERRLERALDMLTNVEELADVGAWEFDIQSEDLSWTDGLRWIHEVDDEFDPTVEQAIEFYHPGDRDRIRQLFENCIETGDSYTTQARIITANGNERWIRTYGEAIEVNGDPRTVRGYAQDITERKQKERDLKRERDRYTTLFDNLPTPVIHGRMTDGEAIVQELNSAFEDTFGYESEELEGERLHDYILPEGEANVESLNQQILESGGLRTELQRTTDDGVRDFRVDVTIRNPDAETPEGYAVYTDITERKEHEDALEELHDATRDLMTATTTEEVATRASETATQVLKVPMNGIHRYDAEADALVPVAWTDKTEDLLDGSPPALPVDDSLAGQVYRTGEAQRLANVREADETFDPETPVRSECILPLGDHGVFILSSPEADAFDATDEALVDVFAANVEAALDHVEQRQHLQRERDRLDEFASIISHDLRNPLNVATGRLELAQAECDSDHLDDVAQAHDRMDTLINDVLTLAREGEQVEEPEPVDLADTIDGCWRTVETAEATLVTETEQTIHADPSRLKQLLENLFRNAVTHGGETVTVTIGELADGFYIADDGPGIPADERDQVFEAGYSTTDDGTGFGLNIVDEIAEAHGWEITLTDSEAGGARFEITGVEVR